MNNCEINAATMNRYLKLAINVSGTQNGQLICVQVLTFGDYGKDSTSK